jgi:hypothetical protein
MTNIIYEDKFRIGEFIIDFMLTTLHFDLPDSIPHIDIRRADLQGNPFVEFLVQLMLELVKRVYSTILLSTNPSSVVETDWHHFTSSGPADNAYQLSWNIDDAYSVPLEQIRKELEALTPGASVSVYSDDGQLLTTSPQSLQHLNQTLFDVYYVEEESQKPSPLSIEMASRRFPKLSIRRCQPDPYGGLSLFANDRPCFIQEKDDDEDMPIPQQALKVRLFTTDVQRINTTGTTGTTISTPPATNSKWFGLKSRWGGGDGQNKEEGAKRVLCDASGRKYVECQRGKKWFLDQHRGQYRFTDSAHQHLRIIAASSSRKKS